MNNIDANATEKGVDLRPFRDPSSILWIVFCTFTLSADSAQEVLSTLVTFFAVFLCLRVSSATSFSDLRSFSLRVSKAKFLSLSCSQKNKGDQKAYILSGTQSRAYP